MSFDSDIDIEDIETYLYSQVYHSSSVDELDTTAEDNTVRMSRPWYKPTRNHNKKYTRRYYENSPTIAYQKPLNRNESARPEIDVNEITNQSIRYAKNDQMNMQITPHSSSGNACCNNLSQVPQFLVPVNNIVVIPSTAQLVANSKRLTKKKMKQRNYLMNRKSINEARKIKYLCKDLNENEKKIFLGSYLNKTMHKPYIDKLKELLLQDNVLKDFDGIESHVGKQQPYFHKKANSPQIKKNVTTVILSSDEDDAKPELKKISGALNDEDNEKFSGGDVLMDDDDVIFVEPKPVEVIEIDVDDAMITQKGRDHVKNLTELAVADKKKEDAETSSTSSSLHNSSESEKSSSTKGKNAAAKERRELLNTPDSNTSNDFLENSSSFDQNKFDFELHGTDFNEEFVKPKSHATEVCETESSCSDVSMPVKLAVFNEIEFESPNKDLFLEKSLESFGNYITPRRNILDMPNLSDISGPSDAINTTTHGKESTNNVQIFANDDNSDSSSESDYDQSNLSEVLKHKDILPHLTPIQFDDVQPVADNLGGKKIPDVDNSLNKPETKRKSENSVQNEKDCEPSPKKKVKKRKKTKELVEKSKEKEAKEPEYLQLPDAIEIVDSPDPSPDCNIILNESLKNIGCPTKLQPQETATDKAQVKGFEAFWTSDKEKFYRESWGQEDVTLEDWQKTMSGDPNLWKIIDSDKQMNIKSRGVRCNRCRQYGHKAFKCKNKPVMPKCFLCGDQGHFEPRCPNKMCTQCGQYGNYSTTFCSKCVQLRNYICKTCKMPGHLERRCPDLWRRYYATINNGPVFCPEWPQIKSRNEFCCSGCASFGHLEHECDYYNRSHPPINPEIQSFEDIYGKPEGCATKKQTQSPQKNNKKGPGKRDKNKSAYDKFLKQLHLANMKNPPNFMRQSPWKNNQNIEVIQNMQPFLFQNNAMPSPVFQNLTPQQPALYNYNGPNQNMVPNVISLAQNVNFNTSMNNTLPYNDGYVDFNLPAENVNISENDRDCLFNENFISPAENIINSANNSNRLTLPNENVDSPTEIINTSANSHLTNNILPQKNVHSIINILCDKINSLEINKNDKPNNILSQIRSFENNIQLVVDLREKLQLRNKIDDLYEKLHTILFGVYGLKDGHRHFQIIKDNLLLLLNQQPQQNVYKRKRRLLGSSYQYLFSRKPRREDYEYLVKLTQKMPIKMSTLSLRCQVQKSIETKYGYFLKMCNEKPFALTQFQDLHYLFDKIIKRTTFTFNDVKTFCTLFGNFVAYSRKFEK